MGGAAQVREGLPPPPDGGWGWVVVFASFMIHIFADGMTYSFGIFYTELLQYFDGGAAVTSSIASILVGVTLCSGPISSALVNKYGCRAVTIAGALLASFSLIISYFAQSILTLCFTVGILTGLGLGLMYLPAIVCVTIYFEKYRSLATGIAVCGSGFGTFILAPLTEWLVSEYSWRGAILNIGALMLNCVVFGILFRPLPDEPEEFQLQDIKAADQVSVDDTKEDSGQHSRPHSIHGHSMIAMTNGGAAPIGENGVSENNRLAQSQPHLMITERRRSHGVMYRKDVFYSGSVLNLSKSAGYLAGDPYHYHPHHSHHQQRSSHLKIPEERSLMKKGAKEKPETVVMCGCFIFSKETADTLKEMLDFSLLADPIFILFTISNFATSIGFNVPYIYLVSMCEERGVDSRTASYVLSIIGISNMVGRIILGYISDKPSINRLNVYIACLSIAGFSTSLCSLSTNFYGFALYSIVYGFTIGAYVGLTSVILVDLLGMDKLTNAFGLLILFQGIASFVGPPITGWMRDTFQSYNHGFIFSGLVMASSGLMLFAVPPLQKYLQRRSRQTS